MKDRVPEDEDGDDRQDAAPGAHPAQCPYCGESVELTVLEEGLAEEAYVEDCPVCCRPWNVRVTRSGAGTEVLIERDDA